MRPGSDRAFCDAVRSTFEYRGGVLYPMPRIKWRNANTPVGSIGCRGYLKTGWGGYTHSVHRLVWAWHNISVPDMLDHINGDKLDNRIENLRPCTPAQNAHNRSKVPGASSEFKGVTFHKLTGKFQAVIAGRYLGLFDSQADAARVYEAEAEALYGDFAKHRCCK